MVKTGDDMGKKFHIGQTVQVVGGNTAKVEGYDPGRGIVAVKITSTTNAHSKGETKTFFENEVRPK
jgi:hypothetical protein